MTFTDVPIVLGVQVARMLPTKRQVTYVGAVLAGSLILGAAILYAIVSSRLTPSRITGDLTQLLGMQVSASGVQHTWSGVTVLQDLRVRDGDREILQSRLATVHVSVWELITGHLESVSLSLDSPKLLLNAHELPTLQVSLTTLGPLSVTLTNGSVDLAEPLGNHYRVQDLSGRFHLTSSGLDFSCTFQDPSGGRYAMSGRTTAGVISLQGTLKDMNLQALLGWNGTASGSLRIEGPYASLGLQGEAVVKSELGSGKVHLASGPTGINLDTFAPSKGVLPGSLSLVTRDWTLGSDPRFHGLRGTGAVTVESSVDARSVQITLDFPALKLQERLLGPLQGRLVYRAPRLDVKSLLVPLVRPAQLVTGTVDVRKETLFLDGILKDVRLSQVAPLVGSHVPACDGALHGVLRIRGTFDHPQARFTGFVSALRVDKQALGRADVTAVVTRGETRVSAKGIQAKTVPPIQSVLPGLEGKLALSALLQPEVPPLVAFRLEQAKLQGRHCPPLRGQMAWSSPVATVKELVLPGYRGHGVVDTAARTYKLTGQLQDFSLGSLPPLSSVPALPLQGRLTGPLVVAGGPDNLAMTFSGAFRAARMGSTTVGGGRLACHVDQEPDGTTVLDGTLSGVSGGVRGIPRDLRLQGILEGTRLSVRSLSIPSLKLGFTGEIDTVSSVVRLNGRLKGQSIAAMASAFGLKRPTFGANLAGPLSVAGPARNPQMRFEGVATNLVYQGMLLGSGHLEITARQDALAGRLMLDRPVSVAALSRQGHIRLPWLARTASGMLGVTVTGATLAGTPQHPVVTPITKGGVPQIVQGLPKIIRGLPEILRGAPDTMRKVLSIPL